jgi:hypothetical protein
MTISETDLKLLKSERMTDYEDGGGKMTSNVVVDGEVNNLFNDISQLDRTYGRVSLRKAYSAVHTASTDTYLGSHIILTDPPDDANVLVTMFSTESWTDERLVAQEYIERYNIKATESRWKLFGSYVLNQMSVTMFSLSNAKDADTSSGTTVPEVGETFVLYDVTHGYEQMFRVTDILYTGIQVFTDSQGDFYKDVIVLAVTGKMKYAFSGAQVPGRFSSSNTVTAPEDYRSYVKVLTTQIADVSEYYGVKKITLPLSIGDVTAKVDSPYNAIVPSSRSETAIIDLQAGYGAERMFPTGPENGLTYSGSISANTSPYQVSRYLGYGIKTFSVTVTFGGTTLTDDGAGNLVASNTGSTFAGYVDYAAGVVTVTNTTSFSGTLNITASPAVSMFNISDSLGVEINEQNRRYVYTETLDPTPAPGTVSVDFRALGKWYRIIDNGNGSLSGQGGNGTVNYSTGSIAITLLAMPDFGSTIIYSWGSPIYTSLPYALELGKAVLKFQLDDPLIDNDSLTISWSGGSVTCDTAGNLTGSATGNVDTTGLVTLIPTTFPSSSTAITIHYDQVAYDSDITEQAVTLALTGPNSRLASVVLGTTGVLTPFSVRLKNSKWMFWDDGSGGIVRASTSQGFPGKVHTLHEQDVEGVTSLTLPVGYTPGNTIVRFTVSATSAAPVDGATGVGTIVFSDTTTPGVMAMVDSNLPSGTTITMQPSYLGGVLTFSVYAATRVDMDVIFTSVSSAITLSGASVDYTTRTVTIPKSALGSKGTSIIGFRTAGGANKVVVSFNSTSYAFTASYAFGSATVTSKTKVFSGAGSIVLSIGTSLIPRSLKFTMGGHTYVDNGSGTLLQDVSATTGVGSDVGVVDYSTGHITFGIPYSSMSNNPVLLYSAKKTSDVRVKHMVFRVPGAPTAIGSFQLNAGGLHAEADFNGNITGDQVIGTIDDESGAVNITSFGDSGNLFVNAADVLYNCVLLSYIPLDPDILGIDTVKLPLDGKVPIYKVGGVGVVHNTQNTTCPNPVTAGSTVSCGRTLLSYAKVFDASGAVVPTTKYTTNLDAGTVTFGTPLDLTGYTQPLYIEHRIEDMALITDVQITGQVKLMKPLRHAYPANTTYLSSALVIGDLQGRTTNMFDQQTWTSVWSDSLIGSAANSSFNDVLYPITTTNVGSIQERWAIVFTASTAFSCYGEYSGLVAVGTTSADFAPVNPVTSQPYFTINHLGWGSGWASGNVLRFNTKGANFPIWLARTTLQSDPQVYTDNFKMQIRGDAN